MHYDDFIFVLQMGNVVRTALDTVAGKRESAEVCLTTVRDHL